MSASEDEQVREAADLVVHHRHQIGANRPVEWSRRTLGEMFDKVPMPTPIYAGSAQQPCEVCAEPMYVGPRMQQVVVNADVVLCCFLCGAKVAKAASDLLPTESIGMGNLGNPEFG